MALAPHLTQWSPVSDLVGDNAIPYLLDDDSARVIAYQLFHQIYWNVPLTFQVIQRGSESAPIYIPTGRTICDTTNRYTGANLTWSVVEADGDSEKQATLTAFNALFARERFLSKYHANKLDGIIAGDWCFHIVANPFKLEGRRISIYPIDAGAVVKHFDPADEDRVIGIDIVDSVVDEDRARLRVQRYQKGDWVHPQFYVAPTGIGEGEPILSSLQIWEEADYKDPEKTLVRYVNPPTPLDPRITAFPVYHIQHNEHNGFWGNSALLGFTRIMAAVNQSITDEELALALDGLGVYATSAAGPVDDTGRPVPWRLGPGRVVENVEDLTRVNGVGDITPMTNHMDWLIANGLQDPSGVNDAAIGKVDVAVAESGIALTLRLAPMLSQVERFDLSITDVLRQMWFDLRSWLEVYEPQMGVRSDQMAVLEPVLGAKLPINKDAEFKRIMELFDKGLVDMPWVHTEVKRLFPQYDFDSLNLENLLAEQAARAAAADPFAARASEELEPEEVPA